MRFYLGTHELSWLPRSPFPLFVSARRLRRLKKAPRAKVRPIFDSSGFSELSLFSRWKTLAPQYAVEVVRWSSEVGGIDGAAIQDWMCEPFILEKTGKTVREHQALTIRSLIDLRSLAPQVVWIPVVQGWTVAEYADHVSMYRDAGFDLTTERLVGVGSVCRRQATTEARSIFTKMADLGLRTHAFGVKRDGLRMFGDRCASADSMAWSFVARRRPIRLSGCAHKTCANCYRWAMLWRERLLEQVHGPTQMEIVF